MKIGIECKYTDRESLFNEYREYIQSNWKSVHAIVVELIIRDSIKFFDKRMEDCEQQF